MSIPGPNETRVSTVDTMSVMSAYQSREAMELRQLLPRFVEWLEAAGVLVQEPMTKYEVARFRAIPADACLGRSWNAPDPDAKPKSHVVYRRKDGSLNWAGDSRTYWAWFRSGQKAPHQPEIKEAKKVKSWTTRTREKLIERDGTDCYFCGKTMIGHDHTARALPNAANDITIEHLLSQHNKDAHKQEGVDVNHIDYLVLAHAKCNRDIGHRPIAEKLTYREIMHDQRSTMWDGKENAERTAADCIAKFVQPVATKKD